MGDCTQVWDGLLKDVPLPDLPKNADTYGIMHGDMHTSNFLVDLENDFKISMFDWDLTCNCWYLIDIATLIHTMQMMLLMNPEMDSEIGRGAVKKMTDALLKGYSPEKAVCRDELRQAIKYRVKLIPHVIAWIGDTGASDVMN